MSQSQKDASKKVAAAAKKAKALSQSLGVGQSLIKSFFGGGKVAASTDTANNPAMCKIASVSLNALCANESKCSQDSANDGGCGVAKGNPDKTCGETQFAVKAKSKKSAKDADATEKTSRKVLDAISSSQENSTKEVGVKNSSLPKSSQSAAGTALSDAAQSSEAPVVNPKSKAIGKKIARRTEKSAAAVPPRSCSQAQKDEAHTKSQHTCSPTETGDGGAKMEAALCAGVARGSVGASGCKNKRTRQRECEEESPPAKIQSTGTTSAEKRAQNKLSPDPNSMQSLASPMGSGDTSSSGKEDISPSQDIYDLFANDDDDELAAEHDAVSGTNSRKRSRAAAVPQNPFVFAVPRPPSSTVSEGSLAATSRPIMGSSFSHGVSSRARPAAGAKGSGAGGKAVHNGRVRRGSSILSKMDISMKNLMCQLEKQAADDDDGNGGGGRAGRGGVGSGADTFDSPCTEKVLAKKCSLLSTPQGSSTAHATPATLPMSQGDVGSARTAHLRSDDESTGSQTLVMETDANDTEVDLTDLLQDLESTKSASKPKSAHKSSQQSPQQTAQTSSHKPTHLHKDSKSSQKLPHTSQLDASASLPAHASSRSNTHASPRASLARKEPSHSANGDGSGADGGAPLSAANKSSARKRRSLGGVDVSMDEDMEDDLFLAELDRLEQVCVSVHSYACMCACACVCVCVCVCVVCVRACATCVGLLGLWYACIEMGYMYMTHRGGNTSQPLISYHISQPLISAASTMHTHTHTPRHESLSLTHLRTYSHTLTRTRTCTQTEHAWADDAPARCAASNLASTCINAGLFAF